MRACVENEVVKALSMKKGNVSGRWRKKVARKCKGLWGVRDNKK